MDDVIRNLAERRRGQLVQVHARPGEHLVAYILRAAMLNQLLLFGDMLEVAAEQRRERSQ